MVDFHKRLLNSIPARTNDARPRAAEQIREVSTTEQVREELPPRYQGAYNTIQTVLNRLVSRGLLTREREGRGFVYQPKVTEAEYLSGSIRRTLAGASSGARQAALATIIGGLRPEELSELEELARQARDARNS